MHRYEKPPIKKVDPSNEWGGEDVFRLPEPDQAGELTNSPQPGEVARVDESPVQPETTGATPSPEAAEGEPSLEQMSQHLLDMIVDLAGSDDEEAIEPPPLAAARCLAEAVPIIKADDPARDEVIRGVLNNCRRYDDSIKYHLVNDISTLFSEQDVTLASHDGLEDLTVDCLGQAVRDHRNRFVEPVESISSPAYGYFINKVLADTESANEVKERLGREDISMADVAGATILDDRYICLYKPGDDNPELKQQVLDNAKSLVDSLKSLGYDPLEDRRFVERCCDEKLGEATQENLYQAGVINDDNVARLYDYLISSGRGMVAVVSTKICPDAPATKFWNTVDVDDSSGHKPASERTLVQSIEMNRFSGFLNSIRSRGKDRPISDYFTDGAPNELFIETLDQSLKLKKEEYNGSFVHDCIGRTPMTPLILDKLGDVQRRSVEAYDSLGSFEEGQTFCEVMQEGREEHADPAKVAEDIRHLAQRFPFLRGTYTKLLRLEHDGKAAILGDDYIGDIVYYDSHVDDIICDKMTNRQKIETIKRRLDTLQRYDLFNGDRARTTNYAILVGEKEGSGELFDDLADVAELSEETKQNLVKVLRTGNFCHIRSLEELENYRAIVSERLCDDLISGKRDEVAEAARFIMRPDRPSRTLAAYDLKHLAEAGALTINDRAVMLLRKKIKDAKSAEDVLRVIQHSPLCTPVVGDDGVARITKIEGSESDLMDKLTRFVTDDWNRALFDPSADNDGVERTQIADDQGEGKIDVVKLNGTPFNILSHTIYMFGNASIYNALMKDPGVWNTARGSSTISASCVSSDYLYYLEDNSREGVTLGFNNISYGGIIGMCPQDAYLSGNFLPNMFSLPLTTCDEFIKQCISKREQSVAGELDTMHYNEVGLFRNSGDLNVRHGRLQPSYIVAHGADVAVINDNSKKFARYFGVPIVLINDKAYYRKNNFAYYNKNRLKEAKHEKQQ